MSRYIAFLRAINVGGHTVTMDRLRQLFEELGFAKVETFIASGNIVFETTARNTSTLEKKIAAHLKGTLGYEVATFIRTPIELAAIAAYRPFPPDMHQAALAFNIGLLAEPLDAASTHKVLALKTDIDDFEAANELIGGHLEHALFDSRHADSDHGRDDLGSALAGFAV